MTEDWMKQPEYILTELQIRRAMVIMNQDCEMDEDEYIEFGKELRSRPYNPQAEWGYYQVTQTELKIIEGAREIKTLDGGRDFNSVINNIKKRKEREELRQGV